ncbi:hypothetical protein V2G26_016201 [Clonostachys chloroleuca]
MRFDSLPLPATMLGFAILCITAQESGLDGHGLSTGNPDLLARGGTNEESKLWTRHHDCGGNKGDTSKEAEGGVTLNLRLRDGGGKRSYTSIGRRSKG